jgi:transglutaminase superfamily protein
MLRKWLALAPADRRLVVEAAWWFVVLRVALRLLPFERVARYAERRHQKGRADLAVATGRIGWATAAVARRLAPPRSCLAQALTAQVMLGRRGRPAEIRFGVRREEGRLDAHAWLECEGEVLVGGEGLEVFREMRERAKAVKDAKESA